MKRPSSNVLNMNFFFNSVETIPDLNWLDEILCWGRGAVKKGTSHCGWDNAP